MLPRVLALSLLAVVPLAGCATDSNKTVAPRLLATSYLDMPIEQIAAAPNGCTILDKDFPGMREHPMYDYFKAMSLNQVAAMSKGRITPAMMAQARVDLASLSVARAAAPVSVTAARVVAAH